MRYCLYNSVSRKQIDFANKQSLIDWILVHRSVLTVFMQRRWKIHRAAKPAIFFMPFKRLSFLCSLHDFIVKHKLYLK